MPSGLILDLQRFSIHDGPGIRTTVFLKGCPLDCAWCHNPESQSSGPEILFRDNRCVRCGACLVACPERNAPRSGPTPVVDHLRSHAELVAPPPSCRSCGECVDACPTGARQIAGRRWEAEALVSELLRDRPFFEESGGGVTFSGGEPLQQAGFLAAALSLARAQGLHTAVDTCGFAPAAELEQVARETDLFLYDLKLIDDGRHQAWTGVSNRRILENLRRLAASHGRLWIRIPVVPGVNDDEESARQAVRVLGDLAGILEVQLLPYHGTAEAKFRRLRRPYRLAGAAAPDPARLEVLAAILAESGHPVRVMA